ncbi:ABC transporter [Bacillaceae bacterium SAS-127]|nr:ABC transporter [Bacillaceae bacterium SAS-127]
MIQKRFTLTLFILLLATFCTIVLSIAIGQVTIPVGTTIETIFSPFATQEQNLFYDIIWDIRVPRTLLALLVGAGLALCGTVMQASVQNPLADPYILGISSGALLGATFSIVVSHTLGNFFGSISLLVWAFLGALLATVVVLLLANLGQKMSVVKLILAGTIVNALFTAISNLFIYFAKDAEGVRSIAFWTMGSLASAKWTDLSLIAIFIVVISIFFISQWRVMNAMLMGEEAAMNLGVNLHVLRKVYLMISAILTAIIVAKCGIIGFVGLIIPHLVRIFSGANHRFLVPIVLLVGGIFLMWADILARIIVTNSELPIGIVTAILGAPVFMHMLVKKKYGFGGN